MEENFEETKKNLETKMSELDSRTYNDWEEFQITLISKGSSVGSIRMERKAVDSIIELHNSTRGEILEMLLQTIIDERHSKIKEDERES